ncbi:NACHT domain-containing protein [Streptomyces sp. NPDC004752]
MRFDLSRLGPREFENLIQSIALAEIGPFVTMFGAGPDGGREATFEGEVKGPAGEQIWDGYGVLQAKYKEVPAAPREEATWLIQQIRTEFSEWRQSEKRSPRPDYVIFASNVSLSATPGTGGIDRVTKEMETQCARLGVKGWAVWHSENICRFLEKHTGIRTAYSAWILPGDILSALYENLQQEKIEVGTAIRNFLARQLLKDRYASLDQAGAADDRTTPLADVFVDLPIGLSGEHRHTFKARCLETLISACDVNHANSRWTDNDTESIPSKFVLVGGPGQGKSTVSQFMCQLYRAYLVRDTPSMRNADVKTAVAKITGQAEKEELVPRARRWPFKIPLTRFADELAQGRCSSVLDYIAIRVSEGSTANVSSRHMRDWLREFPWLLILDGLDEVPGSSNRGEIIDRINDFQIEADESGADLVIIATTRPQGYTDEFSPDNFQHFTLLPLETNHALSYGHKLAIARHGAGSDKVGRLMRRLQQAGAETSTAHLMGTPLQVTIMAVLLDRVGKAPKDRYTLFAEYYRVIYERELEKEGAATNLLRDHWSDINSIHADVGLLLQERSERSGETESRLMLSELNEIIIERLREEGHDGEELSQLAATISRSATERLVFLVPTREGEVSFEIRSLQEFWAADALLKCTEEQISDRLRAMSLNSHWRNVLLFALGNIFANRRTLRDTVVMLVSELNTHSDTFGNLQRRTFMGSRLAVEILNDGMVRAPRYEVTLVEEALKLFLLPPGEHVAMFASCINDRGKAIVRDCIESELRAGKPLGGSALQFVGVRADHGDTWAAHVLRDLSSSADVNYKLQSLMTGIEYSVPSLVQSMADVMELEESSSQITRVASRLTVSTTYLLAPSDEFSAPSWFGVFCQLFSGRLNRKGVVEIPLFDRRGDERNVRVNLSSLNKGFDGFRQLNEAGFPQNHWVAAVANFCCMPNRESLSLAVRASLPHADYVKRIAFHFPWIFYYALAGVHEGSISLSDIGQGHVGDFDDWLTVEESWTGMDATSLKCGFEDWLRSRAPFLPIRPARFVYGRTTAIRRSKGALVNSVDEIVAICCERSHHNEGSRMASRVLRTVVDPTGALRDTITVAQVRKLVELAQCDAGVAFGWLDSIPWHPSWFDLIDVVGRSYKIGRAWVPPLDQEVVRYWADDFERVGLGKLIVSQAGRSSFDGDVRRKIVRAWEELAERPDPMDDLKLTIGLAAILAAPPADAADVERRLSLLREVEAAGEGNVEPIIHGFLLDYAEPSIDFAVKILDWAAGKENEELLSDLYDKIAKFQSSAPTTISFSRMRPS